jgi:hypothetical protein
MNGRAWTDREIDTLRALAAQGLASPAIGARLGRPASSIIRKCKQLGVDLMARAARRTVRSGDWTPGQQALLAELAAARLTSAEIGAALGRSRMAIIGRARRTNVALQGGGPQATMRPASPADRPRRGVPSLPVVSTGAAEPLIRPSGIVSPPGGERATGPGRGAQPAAAKVSRGVAARAKGRPAWTASAAPVTLGEATRSQCRFIADFVTRGLDTPVCGRPVEPGTSWCPACAGRVWQTPTPAKAAAAAGTGRAG